MTTRPMHAVLAARVARRYYLEDRSKSEIADELGISRFRVARLLDAARRDGTVTIEVRSPDELNADLSEQLQHAFDLEHALVLDVPDEDDVALRKTLGRIAGQVLTEILTPDDMLGIAWARSIQGIAVGMGRVAPCPVVQLSGALHGSDDSDIIDLVRSVARAGGGTPHVFYAPLVAADAASARTVRRQPDVSSAAELAKQVTVAIVGIGAWQPGMSTVYENVEPEARERAAAAGAIGEVSGALIDAEGHAVTGALARRTIGITVEELRRIRTVISVAYCEKKADAVEAALRARLVNGLITHRSLAEALLARARDSRTMLADAVDD